MKTRTESNDAPDFTGEATYCPEDNKLRLYVGRVPRDEYLKLRSEGWTALHKQRETGGGDFAAVWTPERRDTALEYAGFIGDEDQGPAERAGDRAERFSCYLAKRTGEATAQADRFDAGPQAHGFQSQARAERSAARHDAIAGRACDSWSKAEYWQSRTAGVISHALHKAAPGVRMGRIKTIEAELRREEKQRAELVERWRKWEQIAAMTGPTEQTKYAEIMAGGCYSSASYTHPTTGRKGSLWDFIREDAPDRITGAQCAALYFKGRTSPDSPEWGQTRLADWINHYKMRLAYEAQMLEAEGGRAAFVEMEVGGWIGKRQIRKVNKSNATGRAVSVTLRCKGTRYDSNAPGFCLIPYNIERLPADAYTPPTAEDLAALESEKKAEKAAAPVKAVCPLVNPTDADAERLQALINANHPNRYSNEGPAVVSRCTQAAYSANSGGNWGRVETVEITAGGFLVSSCYMSERKQHFPAVCKVRVHGRRVLILTDKPQKPFPAVLWNDPRPGICAEVVKRAEELKAALGLSSCSGWTAEQKKLVESAESVGLAFWSSMCQHGLTAAGHAAMPPTRKPILSALVNASESLA